MNTQQGQVRRRSPPQGPYIGQPSIAHIEAAGQQAMRELGMINDPRYQYVQQTDQFGNVEFVPDVGAPEDAMERQRLLRERAEQILAEQHQRF